VTTLCIYTEYECGYTGYIIDLLYSHCHPLLYTPTRHYSSPPSTIHPYPSLCTPTLHSHPPTLRSHPPTLHSHPPTLHSYPYPSLYISALHSHPLLFTHTPYPCISLFRNSWTFCGRKHLTNSLMTKSNSVTSMSSSLLSEVNCDLF